jgi:predicted component of type VI protein secretion system
MNVSLVMFTADGTRRDFALDKERVLIGRATQADLRIPLSSVSRKHCEFRIDEQAGVELRDLGSSNGTFHNGERVEKAKVRPGDQVRIGPVQFTVVVDGKPEKIEPVATILKGQDAGADTAVHDTAAGESRAAAPGGKEEAKSGSEVGASGPLDASALAADILGGSDAAALNIDEPDSADITIGDSADLSGSSGIPLADDTEDDRK